MANPRLLRQLVFGDLRDLRLIERLSYLRPRLGELESGPEDRCWRIGLGYQVGGGDEKDLPLLREIPSLQPTGLSAFGVELGDPIRDEAFHRPRAAELYNGPRVLLATAVDKEGVVRAAYYEEPASFSETIMSLVPPKDQAAAALALCGYLNSSLVRYLMFMDGSSWGLERPQLKHQDLNPLPVPFLADEDTRNEIADIAAAASPASASAAIAALDDLFARVFELDEDELALIEDRLHVQLQAYRLVHSENAYGTPKQSELHTYRRKLQQMLRDALGTKVSVNVTSDEHGLLVRIALADGASPEALDHIPGGWLSVPSGTLLVRRPQRTYGSDWCQLRKFGERREVTQAAALRDGDEIISEMLRAAARRERENAAGA